MLANSRLLTRTAEGKQMKERQKFAGQVKYDVDPLSEWTVLEAIGHGEFGQVHKAVAQQSSGFGSHPAAAMKVIRF
jgi:hypothetical protein